MRVNDLGNSSATRYLTGRVVIRRRRRFSLERIAGSERLDADRHAADLFRADQADMSGASWTYLPYGPFADLASYRARLVSAAAGPIPCSTPSSTLTLDRTAAPTLEPLAYSACCECSRP